MLFRLRKESDEAPRLALSLATLGAVGFSVVLCAQLLWMQLAARASYTLANVLGVQNRDRLLLSLALGMACLPLLALLVDKRRGKPGFPFTHRSAALLAPLALLFVLPGLFLSQVASTKPLFYLVTLSAFGVALRALLASSLAAFAVRLSPRFAPWLARWRALHAPRWAYLLLVSAAAAGLAAMYARGALVHHHSLQSAQNELGVANNALANLLSGRGFRAPAEFGTQPGNYASLHADYCALLFAPLYALRPGADTLLALQCALAGLSAVPLFLLGARLVGQRAAVWISLTFLLLAPLQGALLLGFSWLPAFCLFSFTLYYAVYAERRWLTVFAAAALLASTEAGPLSVFVFGAVLGISSKRTRLALGLCALSALVFAWNTRLALHAPGSSDPPTFARALRTLGSNPVYFVLDLARATKLTSALHALAPLALVPLAPLRALPLVLPGFAATSASNEFWPSAPQAYPFAVVWIPGSILSVLLTLQRLRQAPSQRPLYLATIVTITLTLLGHSWDFGAFSPRKGSAASSSASPFEVTAASAKRYKELQQVLPSIPPAASVVATSYMLPYVSNRPDTFDAKRAYPPPSYVFLSSLELVGDARSRLGATFAQRGYQLVSNVGEFYVFRRGQETPQTTDALRALGLSQSP